MNNIFILLAVMISINEMANSTRKDHQNDDSIKNKEGVEECTLSVN